MSSAALKSGKIALILLIAFFTASASAADLQVEGEGQVWLNQVEDNLELTYKCEEGTSAELEARDEYVFDNRTSEEGQVQGEATTDDLRYLEIGDAEVNLNCYNTTGEEDVVSNDSAEIQVKNLTLEQTQDGVGFVGGIVGKERFTQSVELEVKDDGDQISDLTTSDFSSIHEDISVNEIVSESGTPTEVYLRVDSGFPVQKDGVSLEINVAGEKFHKKVNVNVHDWSANIVGENNPGPKIDYSDLDGYSYNLDIENHEITSVSDTSLDNDDFKLTVLEKKKDGYDNNVYTDAGGKEYKDREWLKWESPESGPGNYIVSLDNIPDLPAGKYRFDMELDYGDGSFVIDQLKVDRSMKFSGKVKDSTGGGIRTEMVLTTRDGRTVPVNAGSDGIYSDDINDENFNSMQLDFFDREKSSPDTSLVLNNVDLGRDADLGSGSEAVGYQYWNNPVADIRGLTAVNMMSVKFAYHINGQAQASMKFNPQNINPRELKVFECSDWNFIGTRCMGEWTAMDDNKVSVNLATNSVNIEGLNLHELPSGVTGSEAKKMLMNAYVVGVNEAMELSGPLSFSGPEDGRVPTGTEVEASGRIVSRSGGQVEDANVEIDIGGEETLTGTTDESGQFTAKGTVPEAEGNYSLKLNVTHNTYKDFQSEVSNDLEVYVKEEVSIDIPSSIESSGFEIQEGAEKGFEFDVTNTGQRDLGSVQLSVDSEMPNEFITLSKENVGSLEPEDSETVEMKVELSEDYCDGLCTDYPTIDIKASAESSTGKQLSDSSTVQTQVAASEAGSTDEEESSEESESADDQKDSTRGGMNVETPDVVETTGEFLASQSSLNIVLALVMLFTMALAGAVKNKKGGDSGRRMREGKTNKTGLSSRTSVHVPDVSSSDESDRNDEELKKAIKDVKSKADDENQGGEIDEMAEKMKDGSQEEGEIDGKDLDQEEDDSEGQEDIECSVCGEEFDTETARKLHEKAVHED